MLAMPSPSSEVIPERPILVVDDDAKIVRLVRTYLERDGFSVVTAADGPGALDAIERHRPALVVLDLMLPELDGRAVIRAVRGDDEAGATPILIISARGSTLDRITGLEDGADDYLPKPFSPAELVLRVKSILRRTGGGAATDRRRRDGGGPEPARHALAPDRRRTLTHADLVMDLDRFDVLATGTPVDLTRVEFRLLQTLLEADGRVLTRDQLLDAVYGQDQSEVMDRTIDVHIGRLRDKLGDDAEAPRYVATVRGVGYRAARVGSASGSGLMGRGIALRIALAAFVSAAVGIAILAIGVAVVGANIFKELMMEAGDSADHAQAMYDQSVTTVILAAVVVALVASVILAVVLGRMLASPLEAVGQAARQVADGDYAARVPRDGPEEIARWPTRSTRWRPASSARRRCAATSSRTPRTNCEPR